MDKSSVKFRCGADPEVFLQDKSGKPISIIGYINADKWNPRQIPDMPDGFTVQEDNVALEFGVPPATSAEEFIKHIRQVMYKGLEFVPEMKFSTLSCIIFPEDQMNHPMAHIFGCEPDFNAWSGGMNKSPKPPHPLMRSAGGHVHVETKRDALEVVRNMDFFLGVPSILMDKGEERKQMYGKGGAHRVKPYGVEYRTLSNFWIFEDRLIQWVWDNTARALAYEGDVREIGDAILEAINNNNKDVARDLVKEFNLEVV
jgi:hypothetical protein